MIKITKLERDKLLDMGCKYFKDIHRTYSHHPHYYLTESAKNLNLINQIRGIK